MSIERLKRAFDAVRRSSEERDIIRGRLGKPNDDGTYTVRVGSRPGYAYVRLGPDGKQGVTIALNAGVPYRASLPVKMRRMYDLGPLVIIGTNEYLLEQFAGGGTNTFSVGPHTHAIGSGLEYEIEALRMEPGRVRYQSGLEVYINSFRYFYNDQWETWMGDQIDLASYQPSSTGNWSWVLVGIDPSDNTAVAVAGTEYGYQTPLTVDLLDDIAFNDYIPCAGIQVREDDTTLNNLARYQDAHGWFNSSGVSLTAEIFLTSAGGWPSTINGCADNIKNEYTTNDVDVYSLDFDGASAEYAQWSVWMPDNWDASTVTFKIVWTAAAGSGAETVEWNLQGRAYANDDAIDQVWGSSVEVSDAIIALNDIHISSESAAVTLAGTPAAGQFVQFRAWRDATNDTSTDDARLLGVKVYYTKA